MISYSSNILAANLLTFEIITSDEGFGTIQIVDFFNTANKLIDKYIETNHAYQKVQIFFTKTKNDIVEINRPNKRLLNIYFGRKNFELIKNSSKERIKILRALALFKLQENIQNNNSKLDWFFDALDKKLDRKLFPIMYPDNAVFPGLHFVAINKIPISPETIIEYPVLAYDNANYELYSELAESLVNTMFSIKNGDEILRDYLKSICNQRDEIHYNDAEILYSTIINKTSPTKTISSVKEEIAKLLEDKIFDMSVNFFLPAPVNFSAEEWALITNVTYNPKDAPEIKRSCDIEEILEKINEMLSPEAVVNKLLFDLNKLKNYSPYYLRPEIENVISATKTIKPGLTNDDIIYVKDKIRNAKTGFINAIKKQEYLENTLRQKEIEYIPQIKRLTPYLNESDDINKSSIWPELDLYLNRIESQY